MVPAGDDAKGGKTMTQAVEWRITLAEMESLCPPCAAKMRELRYTELKVPRNADGTFQMENIPEPMLRGLCDKYGDAEGFRTRCMDNPPKPGGDAPVDPGAICNSLKEACFAAKGDSKTMTDQTVHTVTTGTTNTTATTAAAAAVVPPVKEQPKEPVLDSILAAMQREFGLEAKALDAFKARFVGSELIDRRLYEQQEARIKELSAKEAERKEMERQAAVASFAATVEAPIPKRFLVPLYDFATGGPRVQKFPRYLEGRSDAVLEDVDVRDILREFSDWHNRQKRRLYGELATVLVDRPERPPEANARAELAKRMADYAREHKMDPIKQVKEIQAAVFAADPQLKDAYARS